jgi:hypothetical protein
MDRMQIEQALQQHRDNLARQRAHVADLAAALERAQAAKLQLEGAVLALEALLAADTEAMTGAALGGNGGTYVHGT